MRDLAYINGEFVELDQATVSIEDRGFQFGDSIYEVIKLYDGELFALEEHLKRMLTGIEEIGINLDYNIEELKEICQKVVAKNAKNPKVESGSLYIQITRGEAPRNHSFASDLAPTIIMYLLPAKSLDNQLRKEGVKAITVPDQRWDLCNVKSTNLLPNILSKQTAKQKNVKEAILVNEEDIVTEGSSSNVFIVKDGIIKTHPATQIILGGITRDLVLALATNNFSVAAEKFTREDLYQADEVFITSTTKEVLGVVEVDNKIISNGKVGEITKELHTDYQDYIYDWKQRGDSNV